MPIASAKSCLCESVALPRYETMIRSDSQNFSKFLVKNGDIKWFPARSTKVVCPLGVSLARHECGGHWLTMQSDVEAAL